MSKKYTGIVEYQLSNGEYEYNEIYYDDKFLYYGSHCNVGFLEHGKFKIDSDFSLNENLQELISQLENGEL